MSKAINIKVPKPCHENWNNMTPKEQGRFCGACQKVVVDFTVMSDKEMLDHISKAAGQSVCGRFANDQLNRKIAPATINYRFSPAFVWNLLLATALFFESCGDGKIKVWALEAPTVQKAKEGPDAGKAAIVADTTGALPIEVNSEKCKKELDLPITEMVTLGITVTVDEPVVTDHWSNPIWLKQNFFDKEK